MRETIKYFRKGRIIRKRMEDGGETVFNGKSINEAKRESRRIQAIEGRCLRVIG